MRCYLFLRRKSPMRGSRSSAISAAHGRFGRGCSNSGSVVASSTGKLSGIQRRVLEALADIEPPFVLSGGAALSGVHLGHRTTRDLDLFWRNRAKLEGLPELVKQSL